MSNEEFACGLSHGNKMAVLVPSEVSSLTSQNQRD